MVRTVCTHCQVCTAPMDTNNRITVVFKKKKKFKQQNHVAGELR